MCDGEEGPEEARTQAIWRLALGGKAGRRRVKTAHMDGAPKSGLDALVVAAMELGYWRRCTKRRAMGKEAVEPWN